MYKNKLYRKIGRSKSSRFYCKPRLKQHWNRNTKEGISRSMTSNSNHLEGYSFNPLYKFLNSKANCVWNDVYSEICERIEPFMKNEINYIVDIVFDETREHGQAPLGNQHFNMMFIDTEGILRNYIDCEEFKGFNSAKEYFDYINNKKKQIK